MTELLNSFAKAAEPERVIQYKNLDANIRELLSAAIAVRQNAYVPYSGFKVGAAFRSTDGKIFTGCNVENAAFTPSSCAERTAIAKAVSEGVREFVAGAVVAYEPNAFTTPCGVCRQFIREFAHDDMPIYVARAFDTRINGSEALMPEDDVLCTTIFNLLPRSFHTYKQN